MPRSLLTAAALCAIGLLWWSTRAPVRHVGGAAPDGGAAPANSEASPATTLDVLEPPTAIERSPVAAAPEPAPAQDEPLPAQQPIASAAAAPPAFLLLGRFLLPDGQPAASAVAKLNGWTANSARVAEFGTPKDWLDLEQTLAADGTLRLAFDPPRAYQFTLSVALPGYASVDWRWSSLGPTGSKDLGQVALGPAGDVVARIVRENGAPAGEGWMVYSEGAPPTEPGREAHAAMAPVDPATGLARLTDLPLGPNRLRGYHRVASSIKGPTVEVVHGEVVEATLVARGPDTSRRITARTVNRRFHTLAEVAAGALVLIASDGSRTPFERGAVDNVADGVYSIELTDERYRPVHIGDVVPGDLKTVELVGNVTLAVDVVTAQAAPLSGYRLDVQFPESGSFPNQFALLEAGAEPPEGGRYLGFLPDVPLLLQVDAGEPGRAHVRVDGLVAGETRRVRIALAGPESYFRARVVRGVADAPLEGVLVGLFPGTLSEAQGELSIARSLLAGGSSSHPLRALDRARTDARGVALLLEPEQASEGLSAFAVVDGQAYSALFVGREALLRAPGLGRVEVLVTGAPTGAPFPPPGLALTIVLESQTRSNEAQRSDFGPGVRATADASGTFIAEGATCGPSVVRLVYPRREVPTGRGGASILGATGLTLGSCEVREGDTTRVTVAVDEHLPGSLELDLVRDARPLIGALVVVSRLPESHNVRWARVTDEAGRARFPTLPPGNWAVRASDVDGAWRTESDGAAPGLAIRPGALTRAKAEVTRQSTADGRETTILRLDEP